MKVQDKSGPQWDPSKVPDCMRADEWTEDAERAKQEHAAWYAKASESVMRRVEKARELDCEAMPTPDTYHVTGGDDPDGHTVHLPAEWGFLCTCGDHMMRLSFCKHLMRVGLERGETFGDKGKDFATGGPRVLGLFSQAMQVELDNVARRAAAIEGTPA